MKTITPFATGSVLLPSLVLAAFLAIVAPRRRRPKTRRSGSTRPRANFNEVLTHLKHGLLAAQFQITAEEHLSKGLENNKHLFPEGKWNTIGFDNVAAIHFCSVVFNQEVFNIDLDWSILCPFKLVAYTTKKAPTDVTLVMVRPTFIMDKDKNAKAKAVGKKIEDRIVAAIKEGLGH